MPLSLVIDRTAFSHWQGGYYFPDKRLPAHIRGSDKAVAGQFNLSATLPPEPSEETMKYYLVEPFDVLLGKIGVMLRKELLLDREFNSPRLNQKQS